MIWEYLRSDEFKDAIKKSNGVCVVPIGCLEKHGPHLPVGTDTLEATHIATLAAEKEPACVFPTMYFGEKTGAGEYDGTVIFSSKLRFDILSETCKEIARNGFKKILLYNAHGGNLAMINNFMRSVLYEKNDYMVYCFDCDLNPSAPAALLEGNYPYLTQEDRKVLQEFVDANKHYGHACFVETGYIYDKQPEIVALDRIGAESGTSTKRFAEFSKRHIISHFSWMGNYPNSYSADIQEGMNERIARAMTEAATNDLAEVIGFLKTETISDVYHDEWLAKQK